MDRNNYEEVMKKQRPLSYAEILSARNSFDHPSSKFNGKNSEKSRHLSGGNQEQKRNVPGSPLTVRFQDKISRDNPKFHSFPRARNHVPKPEVEPEVKYEASPVARPKSALRQRTNQPEWNPYAQCQPTFSDVLRAHDDTIEGTVITITDGEEDHQDSLAEDFARERIQNSRQVLHCRLEICTIFFFSFQISIR